MPTIIMMKLMIMSRPLGSSGSLNPNRPSRAEKAAGNQPEGDEVGRPIAVVQALYKQCRRRIQEQKLQNVNRRAAHGIAEHSPAGKKQNQPHHHEDTRPDPVGFAVYAPLKTRQQIFPVEVHDSSPSLAPGFPR
jgi:hypothetical protein